MKKISGWVLWMVLIPVAQGSGLTSESGYNSSSVAITGGSINNISSLSTTADATINGVKVGRGSGNIASNSIGGSNGFSNNTAGVYSSIGAGFQTLYSNTTGTHNSVGAGANALFYNTTGGFNSVGAGVGVLQNNISGSQNSVGAGENALYDLGTTQTAGAFVVGINYTIVAVGTGHRFSFLSFGPGSWIRSEDSRILGSITPA